MGPKRPISGNLSNLPGNGNRPPGPPKIPIFASKILIIFKETNAIDGINFRHPSDLIPQLKFLRQNHNFHNLIPKSCHFQYSTHTIMLSINYHAQNQFHIVTTINNSWKIQNIFILIIKLKNLTYLITLSTFNPYSHII